MAKYDHGGGCPCGLYAECEPNCDGMGGVKVPDRSKTETFNAQLHVKDLDIRLRKMEEFVFHLQVEERGEVGPGPEPLRDELLLFSSPTETQIDSMAACLIGAEREILFGAGMRELERLDEVGSPFAGRYRVMARNAIEHIQYLARTKAKS